MFEMFRPTPVFTPASALFISQNPVFLAMFDCISVTQRAIELTTKYKYAGNFADSENAPKIVTRF